MNKILKLASELCYRYRKILIYGFISVFVTIIDVAVSWGGERLAVMIMPNQPGLFDDAVRIGFANTLGVVTGFVVQYYMAARRVFDSRNRRTFWVFVWTFVFGLVLANAIVYVVRVQLFQGLEGGMAFLVAKFFSIVIPFFVLYFLRKKLIKPDRKEAYNE